MKLREIKRAAVMLFSVIFVLNFAGCAGGKTTLTGDKPTSGDKQTAVDKQTAGEESTVQGDKPTAADGTYEPEPGESGVEKLTAKGSISGEDIVKPDGLTDDFTEGVSDFALELFKGSASRDKNFMVSPASVLFALAMTANGAGGNTLEQMENVLCNGMDADTLNGYCSVYADLLQSTEKAKLSVANSIWVRDGFEVEEKFLMTNECYYDASVYRAGFDSRTVKEINKWVKNKTDGMIDGIINDIDEAAMMFLINTIAFDAEWVELYEKSQIRDGVFTAESGDSRDTDMMYSTENYYIEDDNATGFIKYYKGGYGFVGLLPNEGVSLDEYINSLDGEGFMRMLKNGRSGVVYAAMPKFETEYEISLKKVLCDMGMSDAFSAAAADFGRMSSKELYIEEVRHKTFIKVDERGTKAGAVTSVVMEAGSGMPEEVHTVHLDRPFVYAIIDCRTDIPIFIGAVRNMEK